MVKNEDFRNDSVCIIPALRGLRQEDLQFQLFEILLQVVCGIRDVLSLA